MSPNVRGCYALVLSAALVGGLSAQAPVRPGPATSPQDPPTFRVQIDAVTMDVIVRDDQGRFIADLKKDDFEVYEDGVKQEIASMTMSHGGRVTNLLEAPPPAPPEGVILPPMRRMNPTSGRIFLFFVDDLHMQFQSTPRVRDLFQRISRTLIHEGDLFAVVSSGPSSIALDLTYDKRRMDEAIKKMTGAGMKPSEIIEGPSGRGGPSELRYRAHTAFATMSEALTNLEKVHDRRKALVWVSEGYDFNPFQNSRLGFGGPGSPFLQNEGARLQNQDNEMNRGDQLNDPQRQSETFSDAELATELGEITRAANRANATIYAIDPRGLVAGGDIGEEVDPREWSEHIRKTQDTMRVLAEETGGIAVVNQNDFDKALKRIDAESSDYYVLGYYSSNPDPTVRRRRIELRTPKQRSNLTYRTEYVLKPPPRPGSTAKP